jgi:ABC-type molybdate transport system substrate-binding protein
VRAPIEPGNPGWDPDHPSHRSPKAGGALRGAGFVIVLVAFLVASQQFVTADQDKDDEPAATASATVYAVDTLKPVIEGLKTGASVRYDASVDLREAVSSGAKTDVFVGASADADALLDDGSCTEPTPITTQPLLAGCLTTRSDTDAEAGAAFLKELSSLDGRNALLQAGFDVPQQ